MDQKRLTAGASMYFPIEARCAVLCWPGWLLQRGMLCTEKQPCSASAAATASLQSAADPGPSSAAAQVYGALLSLGDGHGAMGDGEIEGTGLEMSMNARIRCWVGFLPAIALAALPY